MTELITVTSYLQELVTLCVELVADADFSSVMEVQRGYVESAGNWRTERSGDGPTVRWIFDHERFTAASEVSSSEPVHITVTGRPDSQPSGTAPTCPAQFRYDIELAPHQAWQTELHVAFQREQENWNPPPSVWPANRPPRNRTSAVSGARRLDGRGDGVCGCLRT